MAASPRSILVQLVKQNPCLYDSSHKDHLNDDIKTERWNEIGNVLNLSGREVAQKWTGICERYKLTLSQANRPNGHKRDKTLDEMLFKRHESKVGHGVAERPDPCDTASTVSSMFDSPPTSSHASPRSPTSEVSQPEVIEFSTAMQLRSMVTPPCTATTQPVQAHESAENSPPLVPKENRSSTLYKRKETGDYIDLFCRDIGRRIRAMPSDTHMPIIDVIHRTVADCEAQRLQMRSSNADELIHADLINA